MTTETRSTIELRDIQAVEFGCKKCGTVTSRRLDGIRVPISCDNCGDAWFLPAGPESGQLGYFLERIRYYGSNEMPYLLRLQTGMSKTGEMIFLYGQST